MEMKMLPSNGFTYNFNGPSLNTFGQLSVHQTAHLNSSIDHSGQIEPASHLLDDNIQPNQLYELHPHQQTGLNNYNQTNLDNSNKAEPPVISLFKLKSYLNQPKKLNTGTSMQSMFSPGQEISSTGLQLITPSNASENSMNLVNNDSNLSHSSSLQTTSTPFYNNLAPSAIGTSAIVSTPMLLSQSNSIVSSNNQSINFKPPSLNLPINSSHTSQSSSINSTTNQIRTTRFLNSKGSPLKKFICKYCGETYQSKGEMQIHTTAHHRESKPYKCPFDKCNKRFQKTNYLKQHQRIHTNEQPFTCPFETCLRKFKQQSHVKQHIRTHTGDKPYKCKYSDCDKSFSQESNLRSHMRSHESGRAFKCNSCHLTFEDETSLLTHIPKHRETKHTKIHICDYCGKSYSIELYLSKHIQHKHADKMNSKITIPVSTNQSQMATLSKSKLSNHHFTNKSNEEISPSNSPSSSSSIKLNLNKSKKINSSPISSGANFLSGQQTNTSLHINYSNNQHNNSWKSSAGTSSPDSINSNCMSSSTNSEMITISNGNNLSIGQINSDNMFNDLNGSLSTRYDNNTLQQSVDLFYNHPTASTMSSSNINQHQSAFTALGRTNQNSPKYFTSNTCENFAFNKPPQYQSNNNSNQLHSASAQTTGQHSLSSANQQSILSQHNSSLQDSSMLQSGNQSGQMHQLSPLGNNRAPSHNRLIQNSQTSPEQLHHLHHNQTSQHQTTNQQLISLNQIRNYACMPNSPASIHLQPQPNANSSPFVNNIFLNAQNNTSSIQSMSTCNDYHDRMIMILQ